MIINVSRFIEFDLKNIIYKKYQLLNYDFYKNNKLIKIQKEPPLIKDVINTNYAIIGGYSISDDGRELVTCCVIDNLLKGAASQCIQNLNVTFGFEESLSLEDTIN